MTALVEAARQARLRAHAPYSGFLVGAALESQDGAVYAGCNVESASYGLTICAERVAVFQAIAAGARQFQRMVVVTDVTTPAAPCGACRQVLWDLCGDIEITLANLSGYAETLRLSDLFPRPFDDRAMA
jgi:cytidine deaminase